MRTIQSVRVGWFVAMLAACLVLGSTAVQAQVSTERPGSILIFPKVVNDGIRTTVVQITNTGNFPGPVLCYYVDGVSCQETDFELFLTRQQPTVFDVSLGRGMFGNRVAGTQASNFYYGGLSPGAIPPVPPGFSGALVCVEVDPSGVPFARNQIKGEATIVAGLAIEQSKYNALAFQGSNVSADSTLDLDEVEYSACPAANRLNFIPADASDPVASLYGNGGVCSISGLPCGGGVVAPCPPGEVCTPASGVSTRLSLVPCNLDLEAGAIPSVTVFFEMWNEFEQFLSGSTTFRCLGSIDLEAPPLAITSVLGGSWATARITATAGGPVVGIAESFHVDSLGNSGGAAVNLHMEGLDPNGRLRVPLHIP